MDLPGHFTPPKKQVREENVNYHSKYQAPQKDPVSLASIPTCNMQVVCSLPPKFLVLTHVAHQPDKISGVSLGAGYSGPLLVSIYARNTRLFVALD